MHDLSALRMHGRWWRAVLQSSGICWATGLGNAEWDRDTAGAWRGPVHDVRGLGADRDACGAAGARSALRVQPHLAARGSDNLRLHHGRPEPAFRPYRDLRAVPLL